MVKTLGRLEHVELRQVWETEDRHFTPWLACEEHLQILGNTIGMDLELETQEKEVGPFQADLLCKNTLDGSWVLIENQLEKTDHKHLGQLMTYAAVLDAVTIIWVASKFTDEHRSALDWLNKITDTQFCFFGLEVELWRINDSIPAPKFNIVSQPNDWSTTVSRAVRKIAEENLSPSRELQLKYWSKLSEYLEQHSRMKLRSPRPQGWSDFSLGKTNTILRISISTQVGKLTTGVYLYKNMRETYDKLYEQRNDIEASLGEVLEWENNPEKQTAVIKVERSADIGNDDKWPEQHEWIKNKLEAFKYVFQPMVKAF